MAFTDTLEWMAHKMALADFAPKEARFEVNLIGGRNVELTLRPFTLGDKAWMENTFPTEADQLAIANIETEPWSCIIWHQMTRESRDIFMKIKFQKLDENTNKPIDCQPEGHVRYMEALHAVKDLLSGMEAFSKCRGDNEFQDDGVKKKTMK